MTVGKLEEQNVNVDKKEDRKIEEIMKNLNNKVTNIDEPVERCINEINRIRKTLVNG